MSEMTSPVFCVAMADQIHAQAGSLASRWLDRLLALVPVAANDVFPTQSILDHIPSLIEQVGTFIRTPDQEIAADTFVIAKARELGELRHEQRASIHQLLREYELLRSILETFILEEARRQHREPPFDEVISCLRRLNEAVALLTQTTVDTFAQRYSTTIAEHTRRLERFNRLVSHELRQPLGVLQTAVSLLRSSMDDTDPDRRARFVSAIERNTARLVELTTSISRISGLLPSASEQLTVQRTSVSTVAHEAARSLRDMADSRQVTVRVEPDMPSVIADVGQLELLLTNLLSNAIKYADPAKNERRVEIACTVGDPSQCVIEIRDNGLGMDADQLARVFTPFYRGHAERDAELGAEGLGLGLAIVQDCARALGATVDVESTVGQGTTFRVSLPVQPAPA